jgi:DNA-binding MarR family transcriptional regulator
MKPKVKTWLKQLNEGVIKSKTTQIIFEIHKHTYKGKGHTTIEELRKELNMAHQTLTAIVSNIQDEGLIVTYGEITNEQGSVFQKIRYARPEERDNLVRARRLEKLSQWIKRGREEFNDLLPQSTIQELNNINDLF